MFIETLIYLIKEEKNMQGSFGGRVEKFKKDKKDNREEFRNKNDDRKRNKVKRGKRPEDEIFNEDGYN